MSSSHPRVPQVQRLRSSHVMETTRSGRPFVKDLHDMFSTLIISIPMETHRNSSGNYPNSFTTEEAIANLGSLKLTRSHHMPDQNDSTKIITTTTITKFKMSKSTAKTACQTFLDARLFENLLDPNNQSFKDKSIYGLTLKGIHILEKFITINNLKAPNLLKIFSTRSTKIRLFSVERNHETDSITLSKQNIESIFRRFVGSKPNVLNEISSLTERNLGIELKDFNYNNKKYNYTFSGMAACDWLCDFTSIISKKEAKKIVTEFIRRGFINPIINDNDKDHHHSKLKCSKSNHYYILEKGKKIALWNRNNFRKTSTNFSNFSKKSESINENTSNIKKLQQILDDQNLCSLFMNFLKSILCEENLLFLLEVQKFKIKYNSIINENGEYKNQKDYDDLIVDAFRIYNNYLASSSPHELNIDFSLRQPMTQYMNSIADSRNDLNHSQQNSITGHLYDKIQDVIYRLTAIDSVPKFIKTKEYLNYIQNNESDSTSDTGSS
ncbi:RGS domain-containing protein [Glomus cerebriforme]|uniref:RGS domain-containing protein n=1 Tax=Glomus cerebriforme TaxID=658196 RepID=A0A397T524_9GLOM|nr:RGS domain-containing protein [Glomus cerebriforme]